MTKKELVDALATLDDDAIIHVEADFDWGSEISPNVYVEDIVDGNEVQNEATIVAQFD